MLIFVLFALIGIVLEIWGFIWLLQYNRLQKASELVTWASRHGYSEDLSNIPREEYMVMNNDIDYEIITNLKEGGQEWHVPKEYYDHCESRRKWSIRLVVIGLVGQMVQIIGTDLG